jgi:hypothetical protein
MVWRFTPRPRLFPLPRVIAPLVVSLANFVVARYRHEHFSRSLPSPVGKELLIFAGVTIVVYMILYACEWSWNFAVVTPSVLDQEARRKFQEKSEELDKLGGAVRAAEITGTIRYAAAVTSVDRSTHHVLIKLNIRNQTFPILDKNIKGFAVVRYKDGQEYQGERRAISHRFDVLIPQNPCTDSGLSAVHECPTDIENQMAKDDAIVLSKGCTGWLMFHVPDAPLVINDKIGIVLTVTDESGYKYPIRDDQVMLHSLP